MATQYHLTVASNTYSIRYILSPADHRIPSLCRTNWIDLLIQSSSSASIDDDDGNNKHRDTWMTCRIDPR